VWHGRLVQLDNRACWDRVRSSRSGVLGTVHAERGVDAVPVVFVVHEDRLVIPIDTVKPKSGRRLQRLRNLELDGRAVLLVDHYDDDWTTLWWVRVHGNAREHAPTAAQIEALRARFAAYRAAGTIISVIVLDPRELTGWAAGPTER